MANEMLNEIQKYVESGDTLLAFIELPMVHYLTNTRPYLSTSWPKLLYSDNLFKEQLYCSAERKTLPVVIRQKVNMGLTNRPENRMDNYTEYINSS